MFNFFINRMKINNNNNNISFSSLRCPVKPFKIKTQKGCLYCSEIDYKKNYDDDFYKNIGEFYLDIFANTSSHPFWEKCRKPNIDKRTYRNYVESEIEGYKKRFKDDDTTVLFVKDKKGKIVGGIYARVLDINNVLKDDKTLYIDSLAITPEYQKQNIGKVLLGKILKASKDRFSEVFLVAYKEAEKFYKKFKFAKMNKDDPNQVFAISELARERIDYPDYAVFMQRDLGKKSSDKWYDRIKHLK